MIRCPCCRKNVQAVSRALLVWSPPDFDHQLYSWSQLEAQARSGLCTWCGRETTTPARTLLGRHRAALRKADATINRMFDAGLGYMQGRGAS